MKLGNDLSGTHSWKVVGILPGPDRYCIDYVFNELNEYRPRSGVQSGIKGLGDGMGKVILDVRELTTKYITRFGEDVFAVDHVSLKVEEGKSLGIAGESGCG
jgi:methyl coenzyme M reductase subunit C-like uncharacterized protein (methanogenesis marker protein 7)